MKSILTLFVFLIVVGVGGTMLLAHENIEPPQGKAEKVISNDRFIK